MGKKKKRSGKIKSAPRKNAVYVPDGNIKEQLPSAFLARMKEMLGDEYGAFLDAYDKPRRQALRVNTLKCTVEDFLAKAAGRFDLKPVPWCPEGFYYEEQDRPGKHPWHEAGMYYIQEPSAMAVAAMSGARPGERVLDLCAAPGGKSTQLAAMLQGRGLLVSNEIQPGRAKILSQNIERMGIRNAVVVNAASEELVPRFPSFFDRIIVDAPCSGEGMFRKEAAAIPNWSEENVLRCAQRQAAILDCAAQMLSDGGTLVYSTCTFAPQEDEGTVAAFLARHPEFTPIDLPAQLGGEMQAYGFAEGNFVHPAETARKTIRLWPHRLDGEGHFLAAFVRDGDRIPHHSRAARAGTADAADEAALRLWRDFADDALADAGVLTDAAALADAYAVPVQFGQQLYLMPEPVDLTGLKVLRPGLLLGEIRKDRFVPAHSLAMALRPGEAVRVLTLTADDPRAAAFLRGESLPCAEVTGDGWTLVTVDGCSIGWGKCTGGILKNHYPKGLRKG